MQPSLREIHERKSGKLSDKWDLYLEIYEQLFSKYRDKNINLLEIGVQNGGSLDTWSTYFEKAINIIGCDIDPKCANLRFHDQRIQVVVGDATTTETGQNIDKLAESFDLIIEDGSHISRDIIITFTEFFPRLRPGGLYIAEDLHCCYWEEWGGGLSSPYSGIEYFKALCDCINANHWYRKDVMPVDYINTIGKHYGAIICRQLLESISSIRFYDSVCVIEKAAEGNLVRLSTRIIGGDIESVAMGLKELDTSLPIYLQKEARLTGLADFATEVYKLAEENAGLSEKNASLREENARTFIINKSLAEELYYIKVSLGWRITLPLRLARRLTKFLIAWIINRFSG